MLLSSSLRAQQIPPAKTGGAEPTAQPPKSPAAVAGAADNPEVTALNPFVVNTEKDQGFVAASSVAGGRLASDLKDTPVAYSVQTREFLDALLLNNLSEASEWTVNVASIQDHGTGEMFGNTAQFAFRGGSAAPKQRDFFPFAVNYDSYNLERIDYARGPNAVLFGNGGYSGTVNAVSRVARTDRNFGSITTSRASWNDTRVAIDANAALASKKAGLRFDAVYQDRDGWRTFEMEKKKAATLAATINLTRTTQLRLQAETGQIERNTPFTVITDNLSGWDGLTTFKSLVPTSGLPADANAKGYTQYGNSSTPVFVYAPAFGSVLDVSRMAKTLGGNASAAVPVGGHLVTGTATANISARPLIEGLNVPDFRFDRAVAGANFRVPGRTFTIATDTTMFAQRFTSFSGALSQRFGENLFVSVDANFSKVRSALEYISNRGLTGVQIDINELLPDGGINPEFLQPYSEAYRVNFHDGNEIKSIRASLAYVVKQTKLGDFSLNLSAQHSDTTFVRDILAYVVKRNTDSRAWLNTGYSDAVWYRYYWDQPRFPTPEAPSVTYKGVTYPAGWVRDIGNPSSAPFIQDTGLDTAQFAAKAKLFKGRLHLLGALRWDKYKSATRTTDLAGDYPAGWDGTYYVWRPAAPADYGALSYVPKNASGVPTGPAQSATTRPRTGIAGQPQYANDRFQDDYSPPVVAVSTPTYTVGGVGYLTRSLSLTYNYATTFNPNEPRQNIFNSFYGEQVASEWSGGLRSTMADGKIAAAVTYYKGHQTGQIYDPGTDVQSYFNNIILASPSASVPPAPASNQGNKRNVTPVTRFFDTRDTSFEGWEFELTANPTRSWRIILNGAMPRAYQQNVAPDFIKYMVANEPVLRQIAADASVLIDSQTGVAVVDASVPTTIRSPNAGAVASAWNNLKSFRANLAAGKQLATRMPVYSGNIFTDYTFREGALKNFRVGAGVNYRGRQAIGYRGSDTIVDPANPSASVDDPNVNAYTPVYVNSYTTATLVLGYNFRLNKVFRAKLDLKIGNLFDYDKPLYTNTTQRPPGGDLTTPARVATPNFYTWVTPRKFTLSMALSF